MAYFHFFKDLRCDCCLHNSHFDLLHASPYQEQSLHRDSKVWRDSRDKKFHALAVCGNCRSPMSLDISSRDRAQVPAQEHQFLNRINLEIVDKVNQSPRRQVPSHTIKLDESGRDLSPYFKIDKVYTESRQEIPSNLPVDIEAMLKEDVLEVLSSPRYLVVSCRALLEMACKDLLDNPDAKLIGMIDQLKEQGFITSSIAQWAHTIRKLANGAVHGSDSPTKEDAQEVYSFAITILELLYTYPARIEELKQ
ncbi:MAG: DUF4145 domain-containing protein [Vibrio sp.]